MTVKILLLMLSPQSKQVMSVLCFITVTPSHSSVQHELERSSSLLLFYILCRWSLQLVLRLLHEYLWNVCCQADRSWQLYLQCSLSKISCQFLCSWPQSFCRFSCGWPLISKPWLLCGDLWLCQSFPTAHCKTCVFQMQSHALQLWCAWKLFMVQEKSLQILCATLHMPSQVHAHLSLLG